MKCIVLCAGYATRLYPLTLDVPKPLLRLGGKTVLGHILEKVLPFEEVEEIFIVTNNKFFNHFQKWLKDFRKGIEKHIEVVNDNTNSNNDRLGSLGDLLFVLKNKNIKDDVLAIAGDNIFTGDLRGFLEACKKRVTCIGLYDVGSKEEAKKFGIAVTNGEKIVDFEEKPTDPRSTLASMAIYFYPKEIFGKLEEFVAITDKPDLGFFIKWIYKSHPVRGFVFGGKWFDIGSFETLKKADEELKTGL